MATMFAARQEILLDIERVGIEMIDDMCAMLSNLTVKPTILEQIKDAQVEDLNLTKIVKGVREGMKPDFTIVDDGVL